MIIIMIIKIIMIIAIMMMIVSDIDKDIHIINYDFKIYLNTISICI